MKVASTKDVMELFNCKERSARNKMKQVRLGLNKATSNGRGNRGADPITIQQIIEHFKLM